MPARSQSQREWAFGVKGEEWAREHHYDNPGKLPEKVRHSAGEGIPGWAHYRHADQPGVNCGTCDFFTANRCEMFNNVHVEANDTCDEWSGDIEKHAPSFDPEAIHSEWDHDEVNGELRDALEPTQKSAGKLYVISHAKTRYNKPGQPHDIVQSWRDTPLDNEGRGQARKLGNLIKSHGVEKIYSSDLKRSAETADIAGRVSSVPTKVDKRFRPWNLGDFAGHSSSDVMPKLKPFIDDPNKAVPGGESFNDYQKRFTPALEEILNKVEAGKTLALVTHSRNIEFVEGWLGGRGYRKKVDPKVISSDMIDPATVIEVSSRGGKLVVGKRVQKAEARSLELNLRVHGMSRTPDGQLSYRMVTKDGHYVGRTNPSKVRAKKGDVLKVHANDFLQNANGDVQWSNPNVISHYSDAPHSWKEMTALAGGLLKDGADGPAGDIPASNDVGNAADALSPQNAQNGARAATIGPTISDVHVNVPLKNISLFYGNKKLRYQVHKADSMKQLVYGVVLEPNVMDSQDDFMLPHQVEKTAHSYLKKAIRGTASVAKLQHRATGFKKNKPSIVPVESFIAPVDFSYDGKDTIKAGTWVMCMHVEDPVLWQDFLDGKYTGFSVGGTGIRRSFNYPDSGVLGGTMREQPTWAAQTQPDLYTGR